jgi:hypothetical protein
MPLFSKVRMVPRHFVNSAFYQHTKMLPVVCKEQQGTRRCQLALSGEEVVALSDHYG